jgi:hypothetical protein
VEALRVLSTIFLLSATMPNTRTFEVQQKISSVVWLMHGTAILKQANEQKPKAN